MKEKEQSQIQEVRLPPTWCASLCRNAMNEKCIEECAQKRDCSGFELKPGVNLVDMPRFPKTDGMTREEKFTLVTIYLAKIVDHLNGFEDECYSAVVRPPIQEAFARPKAIAEVTSNLLGAVVEIIGEE